MALKTLISPVGWVLEARGVLGDRVWFQVLRPVAPADCFSRGNMRFVLDGWVFDPESHDPATLAQINDAFDVDFGSAETIHELVYYKAQNTLLEAYESLLRRHHLLVPHPLPADKREADIQELIEDLWDEMDERMQRYNN